MPQIKTLQIPDYERVIEIEDASAGMHGFIAIHNTILGPALGGLRIYPYKQREDALEDVLRLAKGMTYKSALAEVGMGGGKSVIMADPKTQKTPQLLAAFAKALETLKGDYIAAEDVGTSVEDMLVIRKHTPYVAALPTEKSSGDPSRFTAWGVFRGIQAIAQHLWGSPSLKGRSVAIQGVGHVGHVLTNLLFWEGAELILTDIDYEKEHSLAVLDGAREISPQEYLQINCDILSPCALGGLFTSHTIPHLNCAAIGGSANNQLYSPGEGPLLHKRRILYAPDYIINSGGLINAAAEFDPDGYDPKRARDRVNKIYDILSEIFSQAKNKDLPTNQIADSIAEHRLKHHIGKRRTPIKF